MWRGRLPLIGFGQQAEKGAIESAANGNPSEWARLKLKLPLRVKVLAYRHGKETEFAAELQQVGEYFALMVEREQVPGMLYDAWFRAKQPAAEQALETGTYDGRAVGLDVAALLG